MSEVETFDWSETTDSQTLTIRFPGELDVERKKIIDAIKSVMNSEDGGATHNETDTSRSYDRGHQA